jgi:hypothetical protein
MIRITVTHPDAGETIHELVGAVEMGRSPIGQPGECIRLLDILASRRHVRIEKLPGSKIRLTIISPRIGITLDTGEELPPGAVRELALPVRFSLARTQVRIDGEQEESPSVHHSVAAPVRPRVRHAPAKPDEPPVHKPVIKLDQPRMHPAPAAPADLPRTPKAAPKPEKPRVQPAPAKPGRPRAVKLPPDLARASPQRVAESPTAGDLVDATVFAPPSIPVGCMGMIQVFAHTPEQAVAARRLARKFDDEAERRGFKSLEMEIARGTSLTFHLQLPGLAVDEPTQSLVWHGEPASVQFVVPVPAKLEPQTVIGTVSVAQAGVPLGHVKFKLQVAAIDAPRTSPTPAGEAACRYRKAFVSYASQDRAEVLKRVQMLARLKISYFQDVMDLEPGVRWEQALYRYIDDCDLFLLFWSAAARDSQWVLKELRYALSRKGSDDLAPPEILPIPIEGPPTVLPPAELSHLHFGDYLLYFMR